VDVRSQAERFADYWHAKTGVNARKADWEATWRNWIRDAITARQPAWGHTPRSLASLAHSGFENRDYGEGGLI